MRALRPPRAEHRLVATATIAGLVLVTSCAAPPTSSNRDVVVTLPPAVTSTTSISSATTTTTTTSTTTTTTSAEPVVRSGANVDDTPDPGIPLTLGIPDLDVVGTIVPVGLLADGTFDVPADPAVVGWLSSGPRPGDRGPAVIAGHVDSRQLGPGLFWRLADLQVGAEVTITTDRTTLTFVVDAIEQYPKDEFPTDAVYGPVPTPTLRLITCGGSFDASTRHYRDNIVVALSLR